ncbi:MAG: hypothetical protein GY726_02275 [Proteobacteria bacterium]|nr:hypothetical protein [Pseudomonadota bacterium]
MRKSDQFLIGSGLLMVLFLLSVLDVAFRGGDKNIRLLEMSEMVSELELSDLSLFTEARYTRHLSQSDLHSAFQDHPLSFEHFPSGSLVVPPRALP